MRYKDMLATPPVAFLLCLLIMSPVFFRSMYPDLAVFSYVGQGLLRGETLYRDVVDVKAPLIYIITGVLQYPLGSDSMALIKVFDVAAQLLAASFIYRYLREHFPQYTYAPLWASALWSALYAASDSMFQCETVVAPAILGALYLCAAYPRSPSRSNEYAAGVALGFAASLKITFGLAAIPVLAYYAGFGRLPALRAAAAAVATFGILFVLPLMLFTDFEAVMMLKEYTARYSKLGIPLSDIRTHIENAAILLGNFVSLLVLFAAAAGLPALRNNNGALCLTALSVGIALFLSVMVEGKYIPYHITRLIYLFAVPAVLGAYTARQYFASAPPIVRSTFAVMLIPLLVLFSPLPRLADRHLRMAQVVAMPAEGELSEIWYKTEILSTPAFKEALALCDSPDSLTVLSTVAPYLRLSAGMGHQQCPPSFLMASDVAPHTWQQIAVKSIERSAELVIHTTDPYLFLQEATSEDLAFSDPEMADAINKNFYRADSTRNFAIYKRR